ncbi:MAG: inorganic diphosphatase [Candidatus Andersenbacteria bacterium]
MDYWHDITAGSNVPDTINVVVEIPKGSQNKYEYDKDNKIFKLDRVLFSPIHYPGDYGLIPQTLGLDNDPLDALVLVNYPTYPGTLIEARPIGVLKMQDNGEEDDKILCVPLHDIRLTDLDDMDSIHKAVREEIAHFFEVYKQLEGKRIILGGWQPAAEAKKIITAAAARYQEKFLQSSN